MTDVITGLIVPYDELMNESNLYRDIVQLNTEASHYHYDDSYNS